MHRQEILYICSHFICPFLSWQETSSVCLALSTPGAEALFLKVQSLARATTSHVRCKWGTVAGSYFLSQTSTKGPIFSLVCKDGGSCSSFDVTRLCRALEYMFSSSLLAVALEGTVNMFCVCTFISIMIKFRAVALCGFRQQVYIYLQSFHQDWKPGNWFVAWILSPEFIRLPWSRRW